MFDPKPFNFLTAVDGSQCILSFLTHLRDSQHAFMKWLLCPNTKDKTIQNYAYQLRLTQEYLFMTSASHHTFLFSALLNLYTNEVLSFIRKFQDAKKFFYLTDAIGTHYTEGISRLVVKDCILF